MINIDDRILSKVTESEYWLLCHFARRIGSGEKKCWPSNKTLCKDTRWHIEKLQKVKKSLIDKGLLVVIERVNDHGQGSNYYHVKTNLIGSFMGMEDQGPIPENPIGVGKSDRGIPENPTTEVLTSEVLTNIPDSKESDLFPDLPKQKKASKKATGPKYQEFNHFKETWIKHYPNIGVRGARDNLKLNRLIEETRRQVQLHPYRAEPTPGNVCQFWDIFVANLHRTWGHGKDLAVIESKYPTLIFDMEHGKQKNKPTSIASAADEYIQRIKEGNEYNNSGG